MVVEVDEVRAGGRRCCRVLWRERWEGRRWRLMEVSTEAEWEVCRKEPSSALQPVLGGLPNESKESSKVGKLLA